MLQDKEWFLKKNKNYYLINKNNEKLPYIDKWVSVIVGDTNNQTLKFESGAIDVLLVNGALVSRYKELKKEGKFELYNLGPSTNTTFVVLNLNNRKNKDGKYGFIGVDYQYENSAAINDRNNQIKDLYSGDLKDRHIIRAGLEVKPVADLSLRLGGGYATPTVSENMSRGYYYNDMRADTDYYNEKESYNVTAGLGYRFGRHSIDLAYVWQVSTADYYPYSPSYTKYDGSQFQLDNFEPIELRSVRNQLILTYNVRF